MKLRLPTVRDFIPRTFELFKKENGTGYSLASLRKDVIAGISVGIVALPLCMAFSIAAGGSPAQGLYTAIIAGFIISLLGGSKYQIAGPTGAFVVIIYSVISRHGMEGLLLATLLAGVILIIIALSGLGRFIAYIPYPVTTAFTTGIGVLIFSQQIKDFFGLRPESSSPAFIDMWRSYLFSLDTMNPATLLTGLGTLALIVLIRKCFPRIPAVALGVIVAAAVCRIFSIPTETIATRFGTLPRTLPAPAFPAINGELFGAVLPSGITIAFLAAIESLLSAVVADSMTGDRHKPNAELVSQGLGNIASALFGGIPATGAIARTAANIKSGAVSPVAGMVHAVTLVAFALLLAPLAGEIPITSLSAVLILVAWDMSHVSRFVKIFLKSPKSDAIVLLLTFLATVFTDLVLAVGAGVVLSILLFMRRMAEVTEKKAGSRVGVFLSSARFLARKAEVTGIETGNNVEAHEIAGPFFFANSDSLEKLLDNADNAKRAMALRLGNMPMIDATGINAFETFLSACRRRNIDLYLCGIRKQPLTALTKAGFITELGEDHVGETLPETLSRITAFRG